MFSQFNSKRFGATVELLDDRVLLSAVPASEVTPPTHAEQVVLTLLQGEIGQTSNNSFGNSLLGSELNAIQVAGHGIDTFTLAGDDKLVDEFVHDFSKINEIFAHYSDDVIADKATPQKQQNVQESLSLNFTHIEQKAAEQSSGGNDQSLLPAVQNVENAANNLFATLTAEGGDDNGDLGDEPVATIARQIVHDFTKAQQNLLDIQGDVILDKDTKGPVHQEIVISKELDKSSPLLEQQTQDQLKVYTDELTNVLIGLLQPAGGGGGLAIPGSAGGDLITS